MVMRNFLQLGHWYPKQMHYSIRKMKPCIYLVYRAFKLTYVSATVLVWTLAELPVCQRHFMIMVSNQQKKHSSYIQLGHSRRASTIVEGQVPQLMPCMYNTTCKIVNNKHKGAAVKVVFQGY